MNEEENKVEGIFIPISRKDFKAKWSIRNTSRYKSKEENLKYRSACEITHTPSGAVKNSMKFIGRAANKKDAMSKVILSSAFSEWIYAQIKEQLLRIYEEELIK